MYIDWANVFRITDIKLHLRDNKIVLFVHNDSHILESETCCDVTQLLFLLPFTLCWKEMFAVFMIQCLFMAGKQNQAVNLLTWRIWWVPNSAKKGQIGFISSFKWLKLLEICHEGKRTSCWETLLITSMTYWLLSNR